MTNKVSQRPVTHPAGERMINKFFTLPVITACKVVTYKRIGISVLWIKFPRPKESLENKWFPPSAFFNETQVSETKCAETCRSNYPARAASRD